MTVSKRYGTLDGLCAYAAIGIVLLHVLTNGRYTPNGLFMETVIPPMASLVFLFMIISAFSICCGYYDKFQKNQIDYKKFYKSRYLKIWPVFVLLCLLEAIISPSKEALYEAFANLTLCFGLLPNHNISVIGVGWFLGVVFIFYFLFPFYCTLLSNKKTAWGAFLVACAFHVVGVLYFFDETHMVADFNKKHNFIYCAPFFFCGGLLYLYREVLSKFSSKHRVFCIGMCMASSVIFISVHHNIFILMAVFSIFVIYAIGKQGGILENRFTRFVSGISLEIYLSHMVIYRVIEKLKLTQLFGDSIASFLATALGTFIGSVIFSVCIKKVIRYCTKMICCLS